MYFYANRESQHLKGISHFSFRLLDPQHSINRIELILQKFVSSSLFLLSSSFSVNSTSSYDKPAEYKFRHLLKELRISATIHQVPEWSQNEEFVQNSAVLKQFVENGYDLDTDITEESILHSKLYMQGYD